MPLNQKKIVEIIMAQAAAIPERCKDYREELCMTLGDIIEVERAHRISNTNVQQQVSEKCSALGGLLDRTTSGEAVK